MKANFSEWGPYLSYGRDPATQMRICWQTKTEEPSGWVAYGTNEEDMVQVAESKTDKAHHHDVLLDGLIPSTTYYYNISRQPEKVFSFKTGLPSSSTTKFGFTINGDMHAYPCNGLERYFSLMDELAPEHAFFVGVGDFINDGENKDHWNAYFHDANDYLHSRPQMNATGNHDTGNPVKYKNYLDAWKHPYVDPDSGAYYLMEYGNSVLFFLDSCNAGGWSPTPSDAQYEWLEENLEKYALLDKWIFLFLHHQIYSTGDFGCAHLMHEVYRPLCQEYHVDAVFYGHDHHYECFWVDREAEWGGTLYFVTGGGGGQHHIDHGIMGDRDGKTKYVWPGRFLNVRKHGVPEPTGNIAPGATGFRNDDLVEKCQMFGVLEPNFVHISIDGDLMDLKCIGWQKQIYHHVRVKRTDSGRHYSPGREIKILDY